MRNSLVLAASLFVLLVLILAAVKAKPRHRQVEFSSATSVPLRHPLISPSSPAQETDERPPSLARPEPSAPEPAKDMLRICLRDIFGSPVGEAEYLLNVGAGFTPIRSDREGLAAQQVSIDPRGINEAAALCGHLHVQLPLVKGENELQLPSHEGQEFGELALLPVEWEKAAVQRKGLDNWISPNAADSVLGRRFLFLRPGVYDISDGRDGIAGRARVIAGERTTFVMRTVGAIRLDLTLVGGPAELPASVPVTIRGLGHRATHPKGYRILVQTGAGQLSFTEYGLVPGTYQVWSSDNLYKSFQETVEVCEGEIRKVDVVLVRRE